MADDVALPDYVWLVVLGSLAAFVFSLGTGVYCAPTAVQWHITPQSLTTSLLQGLVMWPISWAPGWLVLYVNRLGPFIPAPHCCL